MSERVDGAPEPQHLSLSFLRGRQELWGGAAFGIVVLLTVFSDLAPRILPSLSFPTVTYALTLGCALTLLVWCLIRLVLPVIAIVIRLAAPLRAISAPLATHWISLVLVGVAALALWAAVAVGGMSAFPLSAVLTLYAVTALLLAVARAAASTQFIRAPREFWGGYVLMAVGVFAMWASHDLGGMRGFAFGPGTAPTLFAWALIALGAGVTATGVTFDGPDIDRFHVRGPLFVTLSIGLFAWLVRPMGLVPATFLSICAAAGATTDAKLGETVLWAWFLTVFCSLLFKYALNLPMELFPTVDLGDVSAVLKALSTIR